MRDTWAINLSALPADTTYQVKATLKESGVADVVASNTFWKSVTPDWVGNLIGITTTVPAPSD